MKAAWACRKNGLTPKQAIELITSFDDRLRRPLQSREAHNAVERAYSTQISGSFRAKPRRVAGWDPVETKRLHDEFGVTHEELWERSPIRPDDGLDQELILQCLFPEPGALLCIGQTNSRFHTGPLHEHQELPECQFIVPSYMTSRHGLTLDGKSSMHSKSNTGKRRFIVCDFDQPPREEHASIITQLSRFRELALVVHSGGKSLHAWFPAGTDEEDELFWRTAVRLGADPAIWRNRSSFVRLPLGRRENGKIQPVLYFNPSAI